MPESLSVSRLRPLRSPFVAAGLVFALLLTLGFAVDRWTRSRLIAHERSDVQLRLVPYANALGVAVNRRLGALGGLRAFVESAQSEGEVEREFPVLADGLRRGSSGLRGLLLAWRGVLRLAFPLEGNKLALGHNLLEDQRPAIAADVRRALATGAITISVPVRLFDGGTGLIARQRIAHHDPAFPDLATVVVDLDSLFGVAGLTHGVPGLDVGVVRRGDALLGPATVNVSTADPVSVRVGVPDGDWTLIGAPAGGWSTSVSGSLTAIRSAWLLITLLLSGLMYLIFERQSRLTAAVHERTIELERANADLLREVREREAAEQDSRRHEERLRLALSAGSIATWEWDRLSGALTFSDGFEHVFGLEPGGFGGTYAAFLELVHPADRARIARDVREAARSDRPLDVEARLRLCAGGARWLHVHGERVRDRFGRLIGSRGAVADITQRKQLEEQLLHAQKMEAVGTLAGGVAHDFNNVLTAILGFGQLALDRMTDDVATGGDATPESHELRDDIVEILHAAEHAAVITNQLLAFSRKQMAQPEPIDVGALLREMERLVTRLLGERVALDVRVPEGPIRVFADAGQLTQVIVNLVVNARDAMPDGGQVTLGVRQVVVEPGSAEHGEGVSPATYAEISVSDTGVGMPPDVLARIFEPFFTTKGLGKGTGLGLSTVYGIVNRLGGHVLVQSQSAPGEGSVFRVLLPLHDAAAGNPAAVGTDAPPAMQRATILVAEDEPAVRQLAARVLTRHGFEVLEAASGVEALAASDAFAGTIHLLLSDLVMPHMSGRALAVELRRRRPGVRVLFMSGYSDEIDALTNSDGERAKILSKPFTPDALARTVREALAG